MHKGHKYAYLLYTTWLILLKYQKTKKTLKFDEFQEFQFGEQKVKPNLLSSQWHTLNKIVHRAFWLFLSLWKEVEESQINGNSTKESKNS